MSMSVIIPFLLFVAGLLFLTVVAWLGVRQKVRIHDETIQKILAGSDGNNAMTVCQHTNHGTYRDDPPFIFQTPYVHNEP